MKLSAFAPVPAELVINDNLGNPTPVIFSVTAMDLNGPSSTAAREIGRYIINNETPDPEVVHDIDTKMIAAAIVGWTGLEDDNDQPIPYSPEKALELMRMPELSNVRRQVQKFASVRANFFRSES